MILDKWRNSDRMGVKTFTVVAAYNVELFSDELCCYRGVLGGD